MSASDNYYQDCGRHDVAPPTGLEPVRDRDPQERLLSGKFVKVLEWLRRALSGRSRCVAKAKCYIRVGMSSKRVWLVGSVSTATGSEAERYAALRRVSSRYIRHCGKHCVS